jgi:hypothetical protein
MLLKLKMLLDEASLHIKSKLNIKAALIATEHFQERMLQRFMDEELPLLEKTIEKAFEKVTTGQKIKYTHPLYHVTVVGIKQGLNGFELLTCWIKDEDAE